MAGRITKYSEPVPFHKAMGTHKLVIMKRIDDDGVPQVRLAKPKTPTKAKVRLAGNVAIDDEIGEVAEAKKGIAMTDYDVSRGPYHAILDKMALARQAQTGESYAKAYTEIYTDPKNAALHDGVQYDELARAFDSSHGTAKSLIPVAKEAPYDPLRKAADHAGHLGPAHARLHSMAVDHQRAHSGMSYQQAYSHLYSRPENEPLRNKIKAEHMAATMRTLSIDEAQALEPAPPFPAYSHPGDRTHNPVGRIGRLPADYAGG
jgi:hypothetical protein